jgi:hypothetical protein
MIAHAAERLMELEVGAKTGAAGGDCRESTLSGRSARCKN